MRKALLIVLLATLPVTVGRLALAQSGFGTGGGAANSCINVQAVPTGTCSASSCRFVVAAGADQGKHYCCSSGGTYVQCDVGAAGGGGASTADTFITIAHDTDLTAERTLVAGLGMAVNDGGANANVSVDLLEIATLSSLLGAGQEVFGANGIVFEGASNDAAQTLLTPGDPIGDNTIFLPDASGTLITGVTGTTPNSQALNVQFNSTATPATDIVMAGGGVMFGSNGVLFEGTAADTSEILLKVIDPLADGTAGDRTISLPDYDGAAAGTAQVALFVPGDLPANNPPLPNDSVEFAANAIVFEGPTGGTNNAELSLGLTADPASDISVLLPNTSTTLAGLAVAETWTNSQTFSTTVTLQGGTTTFSGTTVNLSPSTLNVNPTTASFGPGTLTFTVNPSIGPAGGVAGNLQLGNTTTGQVESLVFDTNAATAGATTLQPAGTSNTVTLTVPNPASAGTLAVSGGTVAAVSNSGGFSWGGTHAYTSASPFIFDQDGSVGGNQTAITVTAPGASNALTIPNNSGTFVVAAPANGPLTINTTTGLISLNSNTSAGGFLIDQNATDVSCAGTKPGAAGVLDATTAQAALEYCDGSTTTMRKVFPDSLCGTNAAPITVTAAGVTITADSCTRIYLSSTSATAGNTVATINTCNAASDGRELVIECSTGSAVGAFDIVDGSNLKLTGNTNFTCNTSNAANFGVLTLICDGTNFREVARSSNGT